MIEWWPIQLVQIHEKGRKHKQIEIKLRETSLTDVTNTYCWTWLEKVFKLKYKEASSFKRTLLRLQSARVESDNFHTILIGWKGPCDDKSVELMGFPEN